MQKDKKNMIQELGDDELTLVAGGTAGQDDYSANFLAEQMLTDSFCEHFKSSPEFAEKVLRDLYSAGYSQEVVDRAIEIVKQTLGV